jgi:hypothetical protein
MDNIQNLQEQAARAERLARNVLDTLTVERLSAFAAECRHQIEMLAESQMLMGQEPGARYPSQGHLPALRGDLIAANGTPSERGAARLAH